MAERDISTDWRGPAGTHTLTTAEGNTVTIRERNEGLHFTNETGDTWFLPHVAGTTKPDGSANPDVITVAGVPFRRIPA